MDEKKSFERNDETRKSLASGQTEPVFDEKELKRGIEYEEEMAVSLKPFLKDDVDIVDVQTAIAKNRLKKIPDFYTRLEERFGWGGGLGLGGTDICICPECGYEMTHERGTPCNEIICPKCAEKGKEVRMVGKGMPQTGKGATPTVIVDRFLKGEGISDLIAKMALDAGVKGIRSSYDIIGVMNILNEEPDWKVICRRKNVRFGECISREHENLYNSNDERRREEIEEQLKPLMTQFDLLSQKMKLKVENYKEKELYRFLGNENIDEDMKIMESFVDSIDVIVKKLKEVVEESNKYSVGDLAILLDKAVEVYNDYKKGADIVGGLIDSSIKAIIGG